MFNSRVSKRSMVDSFPASSMPALALATLLLLVCVLPAVAEDEPAGDPVERVMKDPPATGLLVTNVGPGTQAATLGLAPGDTIVAYAGKPTPTIDDLKAAMQGAAAAVKLDVVHADGTKKTFSLEPGRIGVSLAPVVKGEGAWPLPAATKITFDFSSLAKSPPHGWIRRSSTKTPGRTRASPRR